jgi:uncharacterized phage protein (TIGR02216 family)
MNRFDWKSLLTIATQQLGLKPSEFWRLTPLEYVAMTTQLGGPRAMTRAGLDALARAFPDTFQEQSNE